MVSNQGKMEKSFLNFKVMQIVATTNQSRSILFSLHILRLQTQIGIQQTPRDPCTLAGWPILVPLNPTAQIPMPDGDP
jgi:hypothetical protein